MTRPNGWLPSPRIAAFGLLLAYVLWATFDSGTGPSIAAGDTGRGYGGPGRHLEQ